MMYFNLLFVILSLQQIVQAFAFSIYRSGTKKCHTDFKAEIMWLYNSKVSTKFLPIQNALRDEYWPKFIKLLEKKYPGSKFGFAEFKSLDDNLDNTCLKIKQPLSNLATAAKKLKKVKFTISEESPSYMMKGLAITSSSSKIGWSKSDSSNNSKVKKYIIVTDENTDIMNHFQTYESHFKPSKHNKTFEGYMTGSSTDTCKMFSPLPSVTGSILQQHNITPLIFFPGNYTYSWLKYFSITGKGGTIYGLFLSNLDIIIENILFFLQKPVCSDNWDDRSSLQNKDDLLKNSLVATVSSVSEMSNKIEKETTDRMNIVNNTDYISSNNDDEKSSINNDTINNIIIGSPDEIPISNEMDTNNNFVYNNDSVNSNGDVFKYKSDFTDKVVYNDDISLNNETVNNKEIVEENTNIIDKQNPAIHQKNNSYEETNSSSSLGSDIFDESQNDEIFDVPSRINTGEVESLKPSPSLDNETLKDSNNKTSTVDDENLFGDDKILFRGDEILFGGNEKGPAFDSTAKLSDVDVAKSTGLTISDTQNDNNTDFPVTGAVDCSKYTSETPSSMIQNDVSGSTHKANKSFGLVTIGVVNSDGSESKETVCIECVDTSYFLSGKEYSNYNTDDTEKKDFVVPYNIVSAGGFGVGALAAAALLIIKLRSRRKTINPLDTQDSRYWSDEHAVESKA